MEVKKAATTVKGLKVALKVKGWCKDSKRENNGYDDNLVAEEKDNLFDVPNDELETLFNALPRSIRCTKSKKWEKGMNYNMIMKKNSENNSEIAKGQTQEKRKRGRPQKENES